MMTHCVCINNYKQEQKLNGENTMGGLRKGVEYRDLGDLLVNMDYYNRHINWTPDANGCINWIGARHRQGYGMMGGHRKLDSRRIMTVVHRITARIKYNRAIMSKEMIIHTCPEHNNLCCNPDHLIIGDAFVRSQSMVLRGRGNYRPRRPETYLQKQTGRKYRYTEEEIQWIRTATTPDIQQRYKVDVKTASTMRWSFLRGYKWLPLPEDTV